MESNNNNKETGNKTMKTIKKFGPGRYEYRGYTILKERHDWKAMTWSPEKRRNVTVARGDTLAECKRNVDLSLESGPSILNYNL